MARVQLKVVQQLAERKECQHKITSENEREREKKLTCIFNNDYKMVSKAVKNQSKTGEKKWKHCTC